MKTKCIALFLSFTCHFTFADMEQQVKFPASACDKLTYPIRIKMIQALAR